MTDRHARPVAVLSRPHRGAALDSWLRLAMLEDVYEVVAGLDQVEAVLALFFDSPHDSTQRSARGGAADADDPHAEEDAEAVVWPGTRVVRCPRGDEAAEVLAVLAALAQGAAAAVVVTPDAPDLPGLLVGKLFRALGSSPVAVCPAAGGGLVALGVRFPVAGWFSVAGVGLDTPDAVGVLTRNAPNHRALGLAPGWHRVRSVRDTDALDDGLEGWESTRQALGR